MSESNPLMGRIPYDLGRPGPLAKAFESVEASTAEPFALPGRGGRGRAFAPPEFGEKMGAVVA
jgi:hypothetical protein